MNIFVGNLARTVTEAELREAFHQFGEVASVSIVMDKITGMPRGFGFVEMPKQEEAEAALRSLNGKELGGKSLTVNQARPRTERREGGGQGY